MESKQKCSETCPSSGILHPDVDAPYTRMLTPRTSGCRESLHTDMLLEPYVEQIKVTTQPERIEHFMSTFVPDVILLDMNFRRDAISGQEGSFGSKR